MPLAKEPAQFPAAMLALSRRYLETITFALNDLSPSPGLENMLQGMADTVESHVYLLQQRTK